LSVCQSSPTTDRAARPIGHASKTVATTANGEVYIISAKQTSVQPGSHVRPQPARDLGALDARKLDVEEDRVKVAHGDAEPGNIVTFVGKRFATDRGLRLEGEIRAGPRRAPLRAWRARRRLRALFQSSELT